ncbi:uncharacterized protein LOC135392350 [Ornithodoros turicata]|uniref:uncharacterized protein LOC135392350 n=1 Tax=Ornithodoros turicata TaxID=34597 RepID=UPI0031395618
MEAFCSESARLRSTKQSRQIARHTSALESELSDSSSATLPPPPPPAQGFQPSTSRGQATVSLSQSAVESQCPSALGFHSQRDHTRISGPLLSLPLPPATSPRAVQKTAEPAHDDRHGHIRKVYKALVELKEDFRNIRDIILNIEATVKAASAIESQSFVLPSLPLQSQDDLAQLEARLLDPRNSLWGDCQGLLANQIMTEYSLKGMQKKKAFVELHICGCIIDGIKDRFKHETEANINSKLGKHLAGASDRDGGRAK